MAKKSFIKNTGIMVVATTLAGIFNLLYQLFMVRTLVPADFGLLDKLMGLTLLTAMPTGTFQAVITKFIAGFKAKNDLAGIRSFLRLFLLKLSVFGLLILFIFVFFRSYISTYYKTSNDMLVVIIGVLLFFSTILPLSLGALQGLEKFKSLGTASIANGLLRFGLGILFVAMGYSVGGALTALILATLISSVIAFLPLKKYFFYKIDDSMPRTRLDLSGIYKYCFPAFIALFSFALLTNMDIQLISPYFSAEQAGYFAVARMIGKIILYFPGAVVIVMFPKISAEHAKNQDTTGTLKNSLITVGLMSLFAGGICLLFPGPILKMLSGNIYPECLQLVMPFVVSMSFYGLCSVFLYYYLSVHNMKFIYVFAVFVFIQGWLIKLFHSSLTQVMHIVCICAVLLFIINVLGVLKFKKA